MTRERDTYLDALRAGALIVVVLGHWIATLPRFVDGQMVATEHLLQVWDMAGFLTWLVQVVPLFVFVSAAVSAEGVAKRLAEQQRQRHWWSARALAMSRPTVTYLAAIAVFAVISVFTGGRLLEPLNQSLTIHLWFLVMLLGVQALLPWSVRADRRYGLGAVFALLALAALLDLLRGSPRGLADLLQLGALVTDSGGGIGWLNALVIWLIPQQLGVAWKSGRFRGAGVGLAILLLGVAWLIVALRSGYPVGMVGVDFEGRSNMLPPTLAFIGVMWLQVGAVLVFQRPASWLLERGAVARVVAILGALGMPLYLWHKLAELPAAWLGERLGLPIDAGLPGEAGFWSGRLWWIGLCLLMVVPVIVAVVSFELRRRRDVSAATDTARVVAGGVALFTGIAVSLVLGAMPGAVIGVFAVLLASQLLRQRRASG